MCHGVFTRVIAQRTQRGEDAWGGTRMDMTYSESARGVLITEERAVREMRDHGITDPELVAEGLRESRESRPGSFSAYLLLMWLGY